MDSSFDNQIIYKLATIETQVRGIADNLTAAVNRLEDKIADSHKQQAAEHARLEEQVKAQEKRVAVLEKYKDNLTARVGGITAVVLVFWTMFGNQIESTIANIF